MPKPPRHVVWSWIALSVLLLATLGFAFVRLGSGNIVVALTIAAAKALIVACVFMELARRRPSLRWVFAGAGLFWLSFLYGLGMTDYATRHAAPWQGPGVAVQQPKR